MTTEEVTRLTPLAGRVIIKMVVPTKTDSGIILDPATAMSHAAKNERGAKVYLVDKAFDIPAEWPVKKGDCVILDAVTLSQMPMHELAVTQEKDIRWLMIPYHLVVGVLEPMKVTTEDPSPLRIED